MKLIIYLFYTTDMKNKKGLLLSTVASFILLISSVSAQEADITPPADVENAPAVTSVGDGEVSLQWDVATDNVGVTGYKVYYGMDSLADQTEEDRTEYESFVKVDDVNQTTVTGLTNGTMYYFSVTALDAAGNESEYYSPEAQAMPEDAGSDPSGEDGNGNDNENSGETPDDDNTPPAGNDENGNDNDNTNAPEDNNVPDDNGDDNLPDDPTPGGEDNDFNVLEEEGELVFTWTFDDTADIVDQMIYTSEDGGTSYDSGVHLGTLDTYKVNSYEPSTTYTFKLTSIDSTGEESEGITTEITTAAESALPNGQDIQNLVAKFQRVLDLYNVTLTWELPAGVQDVVSQLVYQSLDGEAYNQIADLSPEVNSYEAENLSPGKYFFKVTTKNSQGDESAGVIKVVELPGTGPAILLAGAASLMGAAWMRRKKNK